MIVYQPKRLYVLALLTSAYIYMLFSRRYQLIINPSEISQLVIA